MVVVAAAATVEFILQMIQQQQQNCMLTYLSKLSIFKSPFVLHP